MKYVQRYVWKLLIGFDIIADEINKDIREANISESGLLSVEYDSSKQCLDSQPEQQISEMNDNV